MQNVREYTTQEILDRVSSLSSFKSFPDKYWLVGVRSSEDAFNKFDDKAYLFKGKEFIELYKITTNAGDDILTPTNPRGVAVLKSDEIYYDSWTRGLHRGKVEAYVQAKVLPIYRDNNKNKKIEELGVPKNEIVGINIHPATYNAGLDDERVLIGPWSIGCQVFAKRDGANSFNDFMQKTKGQKSLTYCLLKEFDPKTTKIKSQPKPFTSSVLGLTDDDINNIVESIKPTEEKFISLDNDTITTTEAIANREVPSIFTKGTTTTLIGSSIASFINSIYNSFNNPSNYMIIIISLIAGMLFVLLGVYMYRQSSKEKTQLNLKKLEYLSDPNRYNPELK